MAAVIACTRDSASELRTVKATPQMPHTLLFDLRRREEGRASADRVPSQLESGNFQALVRIPGEHSPQQKQENTCHTCHHQIKQGLALHNQTPVQSLIPAWIES